MLGIVRRILDHGRKYIDQNRRYIFPAIIVFGFVLDWLTLNRADQIFDNIVFITHIIITGLAIAMLYCAQYRDDYPLLVKYRSWITLLLLFSLGSLFSGFFVIYFRSASLAVSFPFFLAILLLFSMTEWKKDIYTENLFPQILAYYLTIFLYLIFFVPIILREISSFIFVISGLTSLIFIFAYVFALQKLSRAGVDAIARRVKIGILVIFLSVNILYFTAVIPPIPLAIKTVGVYHEISRGADNNYYGQYERSRWYPIFSKTNNLHIYPGEDAYVFAAIFAPSRISTTLFHEWDWYDGGKRRWVLVNKIPISITGGRDDGYRGFSKKTVLRDGAWRVRFTTTNGQVVGIYQFSIETIDNDEKRKLKIEQL